MAKHSKGKKWNSKSETKELFRLTALQTPDYENGEEELFAEETDGEQEKKRQVPKAVYRVAVILLVLVLVLAFWLNRDSLTVDNVTAWVHLQFVGESGGDGFPVAITGSSVSSGNFTAQGGDALVLSDTSFTRLDSTGNSLLSLRHSFNEPVLYSNNTRTLLFNRGGTGYTILNGVETQISSTTERDLLVGTVAQNGRYALGTQGDNGASELNVYQKDGTLQFQYQLARDYLTAVVLNYDGTMGAVCTVRAAKGELVSRVIVFDFNQAEPIAEYQVTDNYLFDLCWTEGGDLYAVGETAILLADSSRYEFVEYSYDGRTPTAYSFGQGRAFLSVSAYEHNGPSTLLVFRGKQEPLRIDLDERITSISAYGGTVGVLANGTAYFYDYSSGGAQGKAEAGSDAKGIALGSESMAFLLGVSEIRSVQLS